MELIPLFFDLNDRLCVVIGAGASAAAKTRLLSKAGAALVVVAPSLGAEMAAVLEGSRFVHRAHEFSVRDLEGAALLVVATDDARAKERAIEAARDRGVPYNVANEPGRSTFILPSVVDRTPIVIAVGTGGASPVLARLLRRRLEAEIPPAFGRLAVLAGEFKERVRRALGEARSRRRFWESVLDGPIASLVLSGREGDAREAMQAALEEQRGQPRTVGEVYLVGAGPGDPDLLTVRALRLLGAADVVVHDRLVSAAVLDLARPDARRIYVGKQRAEHAVAQEEIHALLVRLAEEGHRVVRLKGGDPFIFGRGGEEIASLAARRIPFEIVPGITAASGCAAYAGIPLTHRDYAQSCVFVAGHRRGDIVHLDWAHLVKPGQTVVIYMGLVGMRMISRELIRHGMSPGMPAAVIENGTTPEQRVIASTLAALPDVIEAERLRAPTLAIVGEVVRLHEKLRWFKTPASAEPALEAEPRVHDGPAS